MHPNVFLRFPYGQRTEINVDPPINILKVNNDVGKIGKWGREDVDK